jgi:hypothetical protein
MLPFPLFFNELILISQVLNAEAAAIASTFLHCTSLVHKLGEVHLNDGNLLQGVVKDSHNGDLSLR